jgi:protein-S-isoprenylcysteine O-methyltransferase Ste14
MRRQAWVFLLVFSLSVTTITGYFLKTDPALIERRLSAGPAAEQEKNQKIIQAFASLFFLALIVFPGTDHRFGWSHLPPYLVFAGDGVVALGMAIVFFVFKANSYTSAVIEVSKEQSVVSTGPYLLVRHLMYSGALLLIFGISIALASLWGLLFAIPMTATIIWRLIDEEKCLSQNLPGYIAYSQRTRFRLIPWVY